MSTLLGNPVIDQASLGLLLALFNDHITGVSPLPVDQLKSPRLLGRPAIVEALDIAVDPLGGALLPIGLEECSGIAAVLGDLGNELGAAASPSKEPVLVFAPCIVEGALLSRALEPARSCLLNVNVLLTVLVLVLLDVQVDGRQANGFAREPADALELEGRVDII